jgi:hypothetical protein
VSAPTQVSAVLSPDETEHLVTALAHHMGPMARILVKRELPKAAGKAALAEALAAHIGDEAGRRAFLTGLGQG